jgi:hypothetical protein
MSDFKYIGQSVIDEIRAFHDKNADLDASGTIDMSGLMKASKKLELFINGEFKALWEMAEAEVTSLKECVQDLQKDYDDTLLSIEEAYDVKLSHETQQLQRSLYVMTRCAKHLSALHRRHAARKEDEAEGD